MPNRTAAWCGSVTACAIEQALKKKFLIYTDVREPQNTPFSVNYFFYASIHPHDHFQSIIHKQKTALLVNIYYELHYFGIQDNYIPEAFSVKSLYPLDFHCSITIYEMQILCS